MFYEWSETAHIAQISEPRINTEKCNP
jgi:hypothetical protein